MSRAAAREKQTRLVNSILTSLPATNPYSALQHDDSSCCSDDDDEGSVYADDEQNDAAGVEQPATVVSSNNVEAVDVRLSSTDKGGGADLIAVRAVLDGAECGNALVDTGASASFVHRKWLEQHKHVLQIRTRRVPFRVILADGSSSQISEVVRVTRLTVFDESAPCELIVMDQLRYDLVIGLPWLCAAGVTIQFGPVVKWAGRDVLATATASVDAKEAT